MSRRMVGPGLWLDEGPSGVATLPWGWVRSGTLAGSDDPSTRTAGERSLDRAVGNRIIDHPKPVTPAEILRAKRREWKRASRDRQRAARAAALCAKPMKIAKQPCARRAGHLPPCLTRAGLDRTSTRQNAGRRAAA